MSYNTLEKRRLEEYKRNLELVGTDKSSIDWNNNLPSVPFFLNENNSNIRNINIGYDPLKISKTNNEWFKKSSAMDDENKARGITKTVASTGYAITGNLLKGIGTIAEGASDLVKYGYSDIQSALGNKEKAKKIREQASTVNNFNNFIDYDDNIDENSVLGTRSNDIISGIGYQGGMLALQAIGVPWQLTAGVTSYGSGMSKAISEGATTKEAVIYSLGSSIAEIASEYISNGVKLPGTGKTLDKIIDAGTEKIKSQVVKDVSRFGLDVVGEGLEEIVSGVASNAIKYLTYMKDDEKSTLKNIAEGNAEYFKTDAWNDFINGVIVSAITGGSQRVNNLVKRKNSIVNQEETKKNTTNKETINKIDTIISNINSNINNNSNVNTNVDTITSQISEYETLKEQNKLTNEQEIELNELKNQLSAIQNQNTDTSTSIKEEANLPTVQDIVNQEKSTQSGINLPVYNQQSNINNSDKAILPTVNDFNSSNINIPTSDINVDMAKINPEILNDIKGFKLGDPSIESYKGSYIKTMLNEVGIKVPTAMNYVSEVRPDMSFTTTKDLTRQQYASIGNALQKLRSVDVTSVNNANYSIPIGNYQYVKSSNANINELRRTASMYLNNTARSNNTIKLLENIIKDRNYIIRFNPNITNEQGVPVNGLITKENGKTIIELNPNADNYVEFLVVHEITHDIATKEMKELILDYAKQDPEFEKSLESLKERYKTNDVSDEVVADVCGELFGNREFIQSVVEKKPNIFKKILNNIRKLAEKIKGTGANEYVNFVENLKEMWEDAYYSNRSNIKDKMFSIQQDSNGNKFVNVDTDQDIFDGVDEKDYNKIAKMYITDYLIGNTRLGNNDSVEINKKTSKKYTNPGKKQENFVEKMKLTPELKNVLGIATLRENSIAKKTNSKFANWEYYDFEFKLDGKTFKGNINVGITDKGKYLYEINNVKKTSGITGTSLHRPTGFSANNIPQSGNNVNSGTSSATKYSIPINKNNTQELENSSFYKEWNDYLKENFPSSGTKTKMSDIKLPVRKDFESKENNETKEPEKLAEILKEKPTMENNKDGWLKKLATIKFIDKGYYVDKLARKTKNKELSSKYDYSLSANGIANQIIGNGRFDNKGNKIGKGLYEIFEPIENSGLLDEFSNYIYHKHNVDRMSLQNRFNEANKAIFGDGMTSEMSEKKVSEYETKYPEFEAWANDIYEYNNANLEMLVKYGVLSKENVEYYNKKYPHYVPTIRENSKTKTQMDFLLGKKASVNSPIKKAKGGNGDIIPLKDAMALRTMQTVNSSLRNNFGLELLNTVETEQIRNKENVDNIIEDVNMEELLTKSDNSNSATLTVFENGEKITFDISDEIYEALKPSNIYTIKWLNKFNNIRRGLLTEYNPTFMITNPLKDIQDGSINSKHPETFAKNLIEAGKQIKNKGQYYQLYIANGGSYETYFNYNTGTNIAPSKIDKIAPLKKISEINEEIEMTPRLAEFISSIEAGDSIETAMYNSNEITTNFKRGGDITKTLDRNGVTFLNAGVQGTVKQIRNVQEARIEGTRGITKLAVRWTIAGLVPTLLMNMIWGDDDDYEELSDYVKNNYYIIGKYDNGEFIRIPKGRVVSVLQSFFQNALNGIEGKEIDLKGFADLIENNLLPSDPNESSLIAPIKQAINNETWYGGDLVPTRLQNLPDAEQYDETTDSISIWLGKQLNISPYKINYVLDQYSGAIGDYILPYLTQEAESGNDSFTGKLIAPVKDKFTVDSTLKNQNISDFYSLSEKLTKKSNSSNATDEDILKNKYINSIKSEISKLYAEKREIQSSSSLKDSDKYNQSKELQKQINELSKTALNNYKNIEIIDNYAIVGNKEYYKNSNDEWTKIDTESPKYKIANLITKYNNYLKYNDEIKNIKNQYDNSNTRKNAVIKYVNSLDLTIPQKAMLIKMNYSSYNNYNKQIISYVNNQKISLDEKKEILEELGFKVRNGKVYTK